MEKQHLMRRISSFIAVIIVTAWPIRADNPEIAFNVINDPTNGGVCISMPEGKHAKGKLLVPESINGLPVTSIAARGFANSPLLTHVFLPSSLVEIGESAFYNCPSLNKINFPEGLRKIGDRAFMLCSALNEAKFGNQLQSIGEECFWQCHSLYCFESYHSSDAILGKNAFSDCTYLHSVSLPKNLKEIPDGLFNGCSAIEHIHIPETVTAIGDHAFAACANLLISDNLPRQLQHIGKGAFFGCLSIPWLDIPESVKSIGAEAFRKCSSMLRITIPSSLTEISDGMFSECLSLQLVRYNGQDEPLAYYSHEYAFFSLPENIKRIGNHAFYRCYNLRNICIPNSVTVIPEGAFLQCYMLDGIHLPTATQRIEKNAFGDCLSMKSIYIPDHVTYIGEDAFSLSGVQHVVIGISVTEIASGAFGFTPLERIDCRAPTPPSLSDFSFGDVLSGDTGDEHKKYIQLRVPANSVSSYRESRLWSLFPEIKALP